MKFLIDECLATGLVQVAIDAGHSAQHVAHIGLQGTKDWDLVPFLIHGNLVMVTRNSVDFRGKAGKPGYLTSNVLHPGLICINAEDLDGQLMIDLFHMPWAETCQNEMIGAPLRWCRRRATFPGSRLAGAPS